MKTESSKSPLNIEQLVTSAVQEFEREKKIYVDAEVVSILIKTGQEKQAYLEDEYKQKKVTDDDISNAIQELLRRTSPTHDIVIAGSEGKVITEARISAGRVTEAMKKDCPFYPWC